MEDIHTNPATSSIHALTCTHDVLNPTMVTGEGFGVIAHLVWRNDEGGHTFRVWPSGRYLTWVPHEQKDRLETARLRADWVRPYVTVPEFGPVREGLGGWWTTSVALPGESAVSPRWLNDPATAVRAIAAGLRRLHDTAPVDGCPFVVDRDALITRALARIEADPSWRSAPDGYLDSIADERAVRLLRDARAATPDLVVCHGDPCSPNTIIGDSGRFAGLVDLAELGVLDRWADLAVAAWSITWNYGPGWEPAFYQAYGVVPDPDLVATWRVIWNAGAP